MCPFSPRYVLSQGHGPVAAFHLAAVQWITLELPRLIVWPQARVIATLQRPSARFLIMYDHIYMGDCVLKL